MIALLRAFISQPSDEGWIAVAILFGALAIGYGLARLL